MTLFTKTNILVFQLGAIVGGLIVALFGELIPNPLKSDVGKKSVENSGSTSEDDDKSFPNAMFTLRTGHDH
ncbi:hypothetical protein TKK_0017475 [Trichogramma kaykai]